MRQTLALLILLTSLALASVVHAEANALPADLSSPLAPLLGNAALSSAGLGEEAPPAVATLDLTDAPADLWQRMRQGFAMPDLDIDLVEDRQLWYLARPAALKLVLERGRKYLYHIVEALEQRGMPTELALLPLVESAYNPLAYSSASASGLWQFIPSTGKDFNLQQNWWVDERRDVLASTEAALNYLRALYEMHGDWQLALASYNWGENAVQRAINKNRQKGLPTDFAHLSMPQETRYYVPKLQALKNIIANPQHFGITLPEVPNTPYFATVETRVGMDLSTAARLAEMPVKEFLELNPSFNRPIIPTQGDYTLVLPADRIQTFHNNLENNGRPLLNWRTYTVGRNERVEQIAARFGIEPQRLRQINGLPGRGRLAAGYTLLVPSAHAEHAALNLPAPSRTSPAAVEKSARSQGKKAAARKVASSRTHYKPARKGLKRH